MGQMRIMSQLGDTKITWDTERAAAGDVEAAEAVRAAEQIFAESRAQGATAFAVGVDQKARVVERFDPAEEQIIIVPRIAGG